MFISNDFKRPSKDRHGDAAKELDCEEDFNPIIKVHDKIDLCYHDIFLHSLLSLIKKNTVDATRKNIVSTFSPRVMKKLLPGRIQK